ncbi:MAG: hypothetical protein IJX30_06435 [Clostridia bacterium]|nr:hypothetical protein [Clostridia bacterium]
MNKMLKRSACIGFAVVLAAFCGCSKPEKLGASDYDYQKKSVELAYFKSSDEKLDFFLNDYFKRHSGWIDENGIDQKVNSVTAGVTAQEFFWQEWMSLAYYPFNSFDGFETDRIAGLRQKLTTVPVDEYGYVWQNTDAVRSTTSTLSSGEHRMGWPFPNSEHSEGMSISWDFNGNDASEWTSSANATLKGGVFTAEVATPIDSVEFVSPMPRNATEEICAYYSPLLEIDLRMYTPDADNIQDIYVWYTTNESPDWSEDKKVSVNEKAFISYDYTPVYEHMLFLPMYAEEAWASDKNLDTYVRQIKVEIVPKEGKKLTGEFGLSYVRSTLDTRHSNNNSLFISSLRTDYDYTGDLQFLKENITKARKAINFFMQMYDEERCLNNQAYLVGHDGDKTSSEKSDRIVMSLSNGYWDISYMPKYDFQSNMYFYKALVDLAYLEDILTENGIAVDKAEASILTANREYEHSVSEYAYTSQELKDIANAVLSELRKSTNASDKTGFWSEETGRFVAGYAESEDKWYDYGYTMWNLEAIYYGVATEAQAKSIMDWVSGARTVAYDQHGSQGEDIYYFEFAPRVNTYSPENQYDTSILNGFFMNNRKTEYGVTQVQNGGAIMYVSFFDLMSRLSTYGENNAYARLTAIKDWYMDVYEYYEKSDNYNTHPDRFYWDYYCKGAWENPEGLTYYPQNGVKGGKERGDSTGILGLDGEFLESFLMIAAIPYGFFGIDSIGGNVLKIEPSLPDGLEYWGIENLAFNHVKYDLTAFENSVRIDSVRGDAQGLSVQVALEAENLNPNIYVNGKRTDNYTVKDGKVYVTVPLQSCTVEIK